MGPRRILENDVMISSGWLALAYVYFFLRWSAPFSLAVCFLLILTFLFFSSFLLSLYVTLTTHLRFDVASCMIQEMVDS